MDEQKLMLTAADVAQLLDVKQSHAYSIIRKMNAELKAQGKLVLRGRVNRQYFFPKSKYDYERLPIIKKKSSQMPHIQPDSDASIIFP